MLEEAPDKIVSHTTAGFEIQPDIECIENFNKLAKQLNEAWQGEEARLQTSVLQSRSDLQAIQREIEVLWQPTDEDFQRLHLSSEEIEKYRRESQYKGKTLDTLSIIHEETTKLDSQKISLAKQLSELESAIMQMRATDLELDQREAEISEQKEAALATNIATNVSSATMRIMLYKKLGIHVEESDSGENDKIVLFNQNKSGQPKILDVDPKYSDFFISNYMWEHIGNEEDT